MNTLIEKVLEWGIEKGITGPNGKGTKIAQTCKFLEEVTETVIAVLKDDKAEIKDGIGDVQVTLILLCEMYERRIEDIVGEDIFQQKGVPKILGLNGMGVLLHVEAGQVCRAVITKDLDLSHAVWKVTKVLSKIASSYDWTLQECLQTAYDVISKRSGIMIEGSFIKSSDLGDETGYPYQ